MRSTIKFYLQITIYWLSAKWLIVFHSVEQNDQTSNLLQLATLYYKYFVYKHTRWKALQFVRENRQAKLSFINLDEINFLWFTACFDISLKRLNNIQRSSRSVGIEVNGF